MAHRLPLQILVLPYIPRFSTLSTTLLDLSTTSHLLEDPRRLRSHIVFSRQPLVSPRPRPRLSSSHPLPSPSFFTSPVYPTVVNLSTIVPVDPQPIPFPFHPPISHRVEPELTSSPFQDSDLRCALCASGLSILHVTPSIPTPSFIRPRCVLFSLFI